MSTFGFRIRLAAVLFAVTLAVCSDDVTKPSSPPSIDIALGSSVMSVMQGQLDSVPVNVACNHYTGSVTLSVTGAPSGLSVTIDPQQLPSGSTRSTLRIAADQSVTPGTYSLTILAKASGVPTRSVVLSLEIEAAPPPAIGVTLGIAALTAGQGQSNSTSITVSRTNYSGPITLTVTGAPPGVTATINPHVLTNGTWSSVLTLNVFANQAPGTYTLTVTATGVGVASRTAQLPLTVTAPVPPSLSVSILLDGFLCAWTTPGDGWGWAVSVLRLGGYKGPVQLSVEGLPPKVTAVFSVTADAELWMNAEVVFNAQADAVGTSNATIRARGVGVPDATTDFKFCVMPAA